MNFPERRSIRLPAPVYADAGRAFSVTVGTSPRRSVFRDVEFGRICIDELASIRKERRIPVYAYCLMPDHVHLLIGVEATAPLSAVIGSWKSRCAHAWRERNRAESFWQRGFYDSAIRTHEDLRRAALYILENPVRAGLVDDFRNYPLVGSMEFDM
ncbi:MAG: transposase [Acidobacteriota bacterium]|nr:transposase [Acidobacteriota bacterium]